MGVEQYEYLKHLLLAAQVVLYDRGHILLKQMSAHHILFFGQDI